MRLDSEIMDYIVSQLDKASEYRGGIVACCPYHNEKSPSFFIYFDRKHKQQWWFKCHGCELTGSLNTLLRRIKGFHLITGRNDFKREDYEETETTELFDDTYGYPEYYPYYNTRGISTEIARFFSFRFDLGTPSAIMPVYTREKYCGYVRRNLDPSMPRYILSDRMDLQNVIWGYDAINPYKPTFITEGIIDAACLWSEGLQSISLVVKGSYERKLELLSKLKKPILIPDNDLPGLKTFSELAAILPAKMIYVPQKYKDVSDWVTSGEFMLSYN